MKSLNKLAALMAAALTCSFGVMAGPGGKPEDKPGKPETEANGPGRGGRPDVLPGIGNLPKNVAIPDSLKKSIQEFNDLRQKQLELQKELAKKLGGASQTEKEALKETLRNNRTEFLEQTKTLRADIREQIKALREALKDTPPVDGEDRGGKRRGRKDG